MLTPPDREWLANQQTIEITTFGRRSGLLRRIEIWWFHVDGRFIITGTPGKRDWLANLNADPRLIVHVGGRDLEATVTPVADQDFRRRVFTRSQTSWYTTQSQLDELVAGAPMVEVHFD